MKIKPSNRRSNKVMRYVALKYFQVNDALLWVYFQPAHARSFRHWKKIYQYTLPMNHSDKRWKREKKTTQNLRKILHNFFCRHIIIFDGTCSWRYFGLKILLCLVWNDHRFFFLLWIPFAFTLRALKLIFIVLIMTYILGVYAILFIILWPSEY